MPSPKRATNADSFVREALLRPHDGKERFDPDFIVTYRCEHCGKLGMGPQKHLQEAVREHHDHCPVLQGRRTENVVRLYYPRSK